jgi:hypothetical protein
MRKFKVIYNKTKNKRKENKRNILEEMVKNSMKAAGRDDQGYRHN